LRSIQRIERNGKQAYEDFLEILNTLDILQRRHTAEGLKGRMAEEEEEEGSEGKKWDELRTVERRTGERGLSIGQIDDRELRSEDLNAFPPTI